MSAQPVRSDSESRGATGTPRAAGEVDAVLEFDQVTDHWGEVEPFSLRLQAGELATFGVDPETPCNLSDLAIGIHLPPRGTVRFAGQKWAGCDDATAAALRLDIGQVFDGQRHAEWMENLDIDENVLLAEQMSGRRSDGDLRNRAQELARSFGLDSLPRGRRLAVSAHRRMRAQWVRAFLPNPLKLLILEQAALGMHPEAIKLLCRQISRVRREGTAILWIGEPLEPDLEATLEPDHRFQSLPEALLPPDRMSDESSP